MFARAGIHARGTVAYGQRIGTNQAPTDKGASSV
jgi:hypothetical protein